MKQCRFLIAIFIVITCFASIFMIGCEKPSNDDGDNVKEEYASLFSDVSKDLWIMTGYEKPSSTFLASLVHNNKIETDSQEATDPETIAIVKGQINSMNAIIELIANLYKTDDFIVSDKLITFSGDITLLGMTNTYTMSLIPFIDKKNNMIYLDWYSEYPMIGMEGNAVMKEYDYVEIEYDFDNSNVLSFRFLTKRGYSDEYTLYEEYGLSSSGKAFMSQNPTSKELKDTIDQLSNTFLTFKQSNEIVLAKGVFNKELQIYSQTIMDIVQHS